jgi:hypothetical protein
MKKRIVMKLESLKSPTVVEYIILILLFLIPFVSIMYGDAKAFTHYGINFWDSIFKGGGILNFYEYANDMMNYYHANGISGGYPVIYDFTVYLLLGIWELPLWIFCNLTGVEETSCMWTMIYSKSIYFVALAITAYIIYKICRNVNVDEVNSKWAVFLFLSSATVFVEIGIVGQLDILGFPFVLLGIYYFQKQEYWKFISFFAIAVSFKQFPLFIFIPLLLLIEKNVIKIILKTIPVVGFTILIGLPFPNNTEAMETKAQIREQFIEAFLGCKVPLYNSAIPIIVILFGIICVMCYLKKVDTMEDIFDYSVFIPALTMFVIFVSFDSNPYWFVYLAPFFSIILVYNSEKYNQLILFETVGMAGLILSQYGGNYWIYDTVYAKGMALEYIFGTPNNLISMETFDAYSRLGFFSGILFAIFIVCMATILYLSRPNNCCRVEMTNIRKFALLRLVINAGLAMIPIFVYLLSFFVTLN